MGLNCSLADGERGQLWQLDSHRKSKGRPMTPEELQPVREDDNGIRLSRRDERFIRRTGTRVTACNEVASGAGAANPFALPRLHPGTRP